MNQDIFYLVKRGWVEMDINHMEGRSLRNLVNAERHVARLERELRKAKKAKGKDPRCPYCDRPVILNTGTMLVSGEEGTYHARCTEPPSEVEVSSGHLKVRRKNN